MWKVFFITIFCLFNAWHKITFLNDFVSTYNIKVYVDNFFVKIFLKF